MDTRNSKLLKNASILSLGTLLTKGMMFIITPLVARWLTTEEYGTFDLFISYSSLFIPIFTLSSGESIFRFLLESEKQYNIKKIISNGFLIDIFGILLGSLLLCIICLNKNEWMIYLVFYLYVVSEVAYSYCLNILRGLKKLKEYAIGTIIFVFSIFVSIFIFVYLFRWGIEGLFLSYIIGNLISIIYMSGKCTLFKFISIRFSDREIIKKMIEYSIPLIPTSISWWIMNVSDRTVISIFLGMSYNGIYAIANKLPSLCTTFFNSFQLSWQQSAIENYLANDREEYYSKMFNNITHALVSIGILLLGSNYLFFKLMFTEKYYLSSQQAPILIIAILFSMTAQYFGSLFIAQKNSHISGKTAFWSSVINLLICYFGIKHIGLFAASLSTLVSYIFLSVYRFIILKKTIKITFSNKLKYDFIVLSIFFVFSYINSILIQIVLFILSILIFIYMNNNFLRTLIRKVKVIL